MFKNTFFDKLSTLMLPIILTTLCLGMIMISVFSTMHYPGNKLIFASFCFISLLLVPLIFIGRFSYFYFFLTCFWLLGFWFKACILFAIHYPLIEPVGVFSYTSIAWDKTILVAAVGLLGLACARLLLIFYDLFNKKTDVVADSIKIPHWYLDYKAPIWITSLIIILIVSLMNYHWAIYRTGVIPTHILPFKLSALFPLLMNIAFSFWLATLLWWDINISYKPRLHLLFIAISSSALSASILSRGLYLYQTSHYFVSLFKNRKTINQFWRLFVSYFFIVLIGMILSVKLVMLQRDNIYPHLPNHSSSGNGNIFLKLATERWIGLEGVMAVSSWPELNKTTFQHGWTERLAKDTQNPYPAISQALYFKPGYPDKNKFFFSSIPGLIAMLYYSGSLLIVFAGVFGFALFYSLIEKLLIILLKNPFILSFYGIYTTFLLSMLGDGHILFAQTIEIVVVPCLLYVISDAFIPERFLNTFKINRSNSSY